MKEISIWFLTAVISIAFVVNEAFKYRAWGRSEDSHKVTEQAIVDFINKGDRFTRRDGLALCTQIRKVVASVDCSSWEDG